jgi:hypothetical protein
MRATILPQANGNRQTANGTNPEANLRQQATVQGTGAGADLSARQVTRVRLKDEEAFIRIVQEIHLSAQDLDEAAARPGGETRVNRAVARTFGTSEARIRAERGKHHLGVGELTIARALARATANSDRPLTLRQVIALRQQEGGWGQVFHRLKAEGLVDEKNLGQIVRHARTAAETSRPAGPTATARGGAAGRATDGDSARTEERGTPAARPRAQASAAPADERRNATDQTVRTRAEVRDTAGHRSGPGPGHRFDPGTLDDRARAPESARARPVTITTAGNRTDLAGGGREGGRGTAREPHSAGAGGGSSSSTRPTAAAHGRGHAASVAVTSAGNGAQAGGRAALTSAGHGRDGHPSAGQGGHRR